MRLDGMTAASRNTWVMTVQEKLHDVEIYTIQDFIECLQSINRQLIRREHKALHFTTMKLEKGVRVRRLAWRH